MLKQNRGNGGQGVWKVEILRGANTVRVLHARRGSVLEDLPLGDFMSRCNAYFAAPNGCIIDQPFQPRLPDGMIRCYMGGDKVPGFGHQLIKALIPPPPEGPDSPAAQPGPRIMHGPDAAPFQTRRVKMESEWTPAMIDVLGIDVGSPPLIWDADFLYGPHTPSGDDTYVLCEINVSCVSPIPDQAPAAMARLVKERFTTARAVTLMRWLFLALALLSIPIAARAATGTSAPLMLERKIVLKNVSGRIDHMAIDLARKRLFVAELGNGALEVLDVTTGTVLRRIEGLKEPQGVGYSEKADMVAVASAGDGTVRFYRGEDFTPAGMVGLGDDADNVRVDPKTGNFVVGYGDGALAIIDPVRKTKLSDVRLPAHPEGFQLDVERGLAFVNVPDAQQIAVVNLATNTSPTAWRTPNARANFPMAYDPERQELAIVFRNPAELVVMDANNGQAKVRLPACGDADDVFFDSRRARIYVSCGSGEVASWHRDAAGYTSLPPLRTAGGARTSLFVPALDRLFVAERARLLGSTATILVLRPEENGAD